MKAYFLILAIGIGYLFPLSALTQPIDYWHVLFPDINIEFPLTTTFMWVNLTVLGCIVFFTQHPSVTFRIVGGFIGQLIILICVPSLPSFCGGNENVLFWLVMGATAIAACATALIDSVAIGFASEYPPKVLEGLQLGIGLSTLIGSVYRIGTKVVFSADQVIESSIIYFYVGGFTIFSCIVAYYALLSLPLSQDIHSNKSQATAEENRRLLNELMDQPAYDSLKSDERNQQPVDTERGKEITSFSPPTSSSSSQSSAWLNKLRILKKVAFKQFLVFSVFFISLFLWPGIVTEIPSYSFPYLEETRWWSLLLLLTFSVLDCVGRLLTPYRLGLNSSNIWIFVLARLLLVPLFFYLAYYGKDSSFFLFHSDFVSVGLVSLLGFTNGYIGSLCIIMVTEDVLPDEKHIAGAFTGFFLNVGLVFGSTAALLFHQ